MTKEELKQEAEEWIKDHSGLIGSYEFVKYDYDSMQKAYLAGAEPREKRIETQAEEIKKLKKELDVWQVAYAELTRHRDELKQELKKI